MRFLRELLRAPAIWQEDAAGNIEWSISGGELLFYCCAALAFAIVLRGIAA